MYDLYSQVTSVPASVAGQSSEWSPKIVGSSPAVGKIFITVFLTLYSFVLYFSMRLIQFHVYFNHHALPHLYVMLEILFSFQQWKNFENPLRIGVLLFLAHSVYCACLYVVCGLPRSRGRTYRTCQEVRRHWALWHSSLHCITTNLRRCMSWMRLTQHSTSRMCPLLPTTSRSSVCFCRVCLLAWMLFSCECWMLKTDTRKPLEAIVSLNLVTR